jgi:hypothetical protein
VFSVESGTCWLETLPAVPGKIVVLTTVWSAAALAGSATAPAVATQATTAANANRRPGKIPGRRRHDASDRDERNATYLTLTVLSFVLLVACPLCVFTSRSTQR